jgi:hypothetical protein
MKSTFKKYNIGSPKRALGASRKKHSSLKKYNIGNPRRPLTEIELMEQDPSIIKFSTPKASPHPYRKEIKHITPRTAAWEKWAEKGESGYIHDYEEDEDDALAKEQRAKLGIRSPEKYTTFEDIQTRYMTEAHKKKPLTDAFEQVDEEAWKRKKDDSPNQRADKRRRRSRSRSRGRSRGHGRSRGRSRR